MSRKYQVNEQFFDKWSPEMSYILGYFAADGNMYQGPADKRIQFVTQPKDLNHLKKIKKIMCSQHPIKLYPRLSFGKMRDVYVCQIFSVKLYNSLLELGQTPKKSLTLKFPKIPKKYLKDFIRGFFSGDGCICASRTYNNKKYYYYLRSEFCSGSKQFLDVLKEKLKENNILGGKVGRYKNQACWKLGYTHKASLKLFHFMYDNVPPSQFLERKYNKFLPYIT